MNRDDIIRMAQEAGWDDHHAQFDTRFQTFAALVIANHPPQSYMTWQEGYEAGKQTEREACAKVCEEYETNNDIAETWLNIVSEVIRARG